MIKDYLLGGIDPALFAACFIAAGVGALITMLAGTTLRDPDSPESPIKFSWSYLWSDNIKRIILNILLILVCLRFMPEIFDMELQMWKALLVGLGIDGLLLIVKQKTTLLDPKPKTE